MLNRRVISSGNFAVNRKTWAPRNFALWSALICITAAAVPGQNTTVFSGPVTASGTRPDCGAWSSTGTLTITLTPQLSSLVPNGGPVTGTFINSGTYTACNIQSTSGSGTVTGSVGAGGQVSLVLAPSTGCTFTGSGTISEISGAIPSACFDYPGSGSFDVTSRSSPSGSTSSTMCVPFPSGLIPFTSISYVTAADYAGDHLVVGVPSPNLLEAIANLPLPAFANQTFCGAQVQLAPGQYYPSVYVPTADESGGNFSAFSGLLVNPVNNLPYPNGVIPAGQLGSVFAWRIGAVQASSGARDWVLTGSLMEPQAYSASVLLPSGKVLVFGDDSIAQVFDPVAGTFSPGGQALFGHGPFPSVVPLNDGTVLIVGGQNAPSGAELYDPVSRSFTALPPPRMPHGWIHTATLLNDGRVLIVGGLQQAGSSGNPDGAGDSSSGADIYDPATRTFTAAGPMNQNRNNHTATLLGDGRVLIAGGQFLGGNAPDQPIFDSAELFDPSTGAFTLAANRMSAPRTSHFASPLPNGMALVGGGFSASPGSADLFNPSTNTFSPTGFLNSTTRANSTATLLPSGQVLITGGDGSSSLQATTTAELYSSATGTFALTGSMISPRIFFTSTLLLDGRVMSAGGVLAISPGAPMPPLSSAEIYTPTVEGLVTSQSGLTFQFAQGNSAAQSQSIAVLSTTATIPWKVSTRTYEGGNWLSVSTTSGNSVPGAAPTTLSITANPSGLSAQTYYGSVALTPTDGIHPPVSIAIVLNIVPAGTLAPPIVSPSGIVLTGNPGSTLAPQTFTISNLTSSPISFTAAGSNTPLFFNVAPTSATIPAAQSATLKITPNITGLTAGAYKGTVRLTFADGSTQIVQLLLVLSPDASSSSTSVHRLATSTCTPTRLLPILTSIGSGFNVLAAWPIPVIVEVVDDCANAMNTGSVIVSFSDGDPPIGLISTGDGYWAGTWVPQNNAPGFSARADAQQAPLTGTVSINGATASNPTVPVISAGGVVSSGDFASPPAQGLLVSIFGSGLADSAVGGTLPLGNQIGSTQVLLGNELLPLLYASDTLINVLIPYDVALNTTEQLVVERASAISVPVKTAVFSAAPSILSTNGSGSGQGHIYVIGAQGQETLADQNAPAAARNNLVIYCIGLGAVNPAVVGGSIAPSSPPAQATLPVSVTLGGVTTTAGFAGLTPGEAGLYQINVTIPPGVPTGSQVPVTISAGAASSSSSIYMAIQ